MIPSYLFYVACQPTVLMLTFALLVVHHFPHSNVLVERHYMMTLPTFLMMKRFHEGKTCRQTTVVYI